MTRRPDARTSGPFETIRIAGCVNAPAIFLPSPMLAKPDAGRLAQGIAPAPAGPEA